MKGVQSWKWSRGKEPRSGGEPVMDSLWRGARQLERRSRGEEGELT